MIIMMNCNGRLNGKYCVIFGPKLSGPPGYQFYRGSDYRSAIVFRIREKNLKDCGENYLNRSFIRQMSDERDRKYGKKI
jgi:hypothetical protein